MPQHETPYDHATTASKDLHYIRDEKHGHVASVIVKRPEVRNAPHTYAYQERRACWRDISHDPGIHVGIVSGTGETFSAGRDLTFLAAHPAEGKRMPHEDPTNPNDEWGGGGLPSALPLEKPLISAINGLAVGVGLNHALSGQLRVMAEETWISDTHTLIGRLGSPQNLHHQMPRAELMAAAEDLAAMVCRGAPLATEAAVRLYRLRSAFPEALVSDQRALDRETAESEDGAEGPRVFHEKRRPVWKRR